MRCAWIILSLSAVGCAVAPPQPITGAQFLAQQEGLALAEAERRIRHQDQLQPLVRAASADPGFGEARFVHRPVYRIVFSFTDGKPRPALIAMAPPDMRPHLAFVKAIRSRAEMDRSANELNDALRPLGRAFNIMSSVETG